MPTVWSWLGHPWQYCKDNASITDAAEKAHAIRLSSCNMTQASSTITIPAPVGTIWEVISDFGAAGHYLAGVLDCTVEGEGIGALRTLTSAGGSTIVERLEMLNAETYRLPRVG